MSVKTLEKIPKEKRRKPTDVAQNYLNQLAKRYSIPQIIGAVNPSHLSDI